MLTQRSNNTAWLAVSPEIGPQFPEHGAGNRAPISGKTPPPEIGAQFGPLAGGIEPATFRLQACAPPTRPNSGGQHGHTSSFATWPSPPVPARPKPKSKIQTPNGPFGFWILEFGFWILDFGVWILDFGFWISDFGFWILDFGFRILDFGFWILDFGFWILDFGFWISLVFVLFAAAPNGPVWILDFGFRILDFGFWISDFGFWILDFGFWILDFGLGLGSIDTVWILHKIFASHADSGRRISQYIVLDDQHRENILQHASHDRPLSLNSDLCLEDSCLLAKGMLDKKNCCCAGRATEF